MSIFNQPTETGATEGTDFFVPLATTAPHGPPPTGQWMLVGWQPANTAAGHFVSNTHDAGANTGFHPSVPATAQLGFADASGSTTGQMEGGTVGAYLNSADILSPVTGQKMMITPEYIWPSGQEPYPFFYPNSRLAASLNVQIPVATGPSTYWLADFLFVGPAPGNVRVSFGVKIFSLGDTNPVVGAKYDTPGNSYQLNVPLGGSDPLAPQFVTPNAGSSLTASAPWSGFHTYSFTTTRAQFVAALNYLISQFPGHVTSNDPTQYKLQEIHANAEMTFNPGDTATLGWSMNTLTVLPATPSTLPDEFWQIAPALNGNEYSATPGGNPSQPVWSHIPDFTNESAAFNVNIQQTYLVPSSGATVTLVNSVATVSAYLKRLTGKGLLVGQHSDFPSAAAGWTPTSATDTLTGIEAQSGGLDPAMFGVRLGYEGVGAYADPIALGNNWLARGGILFVSIGLGNPTFGNAINPFNYGSGNTRGAAGPGNVNITDLLAAQPNTTATYLAWKAGMDRAVTFFKALTGPCICRIYTEYNRGGDSWWSAINDNGTGVLTAAQYAQLWSMTVAYVAAQGVTNVLWALNLSSRLATAPTDFTSVYNDATNPASAWVNVLTVDHYPPDGGGPMGFSGDGVSDAPVIAQFGTSAPGVPIMYAETSSVSGATTTPNVGDPNIYVLNYIKTHYPTVVGFLMYGWQLAAWQQNVGGTAVNAMMTNPYAITLTKLSSMLPAGFSYDPVTTVLAYDGTGVGGPLAVHWNAHYNGATADSNNVQLSGIGSGSGGGVYNPSGIRLGLCFIGTSGGAWPAGSALAYQQYAAACNFDIQGGWYTLGASLPGGSWKQFNLTLNGLAPANSRAGAIRYYYTETATNGNSNMNPMLSQGPINNMIGGWWGWGNGAAQSGHITEYGGLWVTNQSDKAPTDSQGRLFEEMYVDEMIKWVYTGASYFPASDQDPNAGGVYHDNFFQASQVGYDYNQSGSAAGTGDTAFQQSVRNGLQRGQKRLQQLHPNVLRLANIARMAMPGGLPNTGQTGVVQGGIYEAAFGISNATITWNGWGGFLSQYAGQLAACAPPRLLIVSHDNMRADGSDPYQGAHKAQRFGLTATHLLDGYYFVDGNENYLFSEGNFWFDEWSFDVNGVCYAFNGTAASVLPGRTMLGKPTSAIGGISGNGSYQVIGGLYVRLFYNSANSTNWAVICYPPITSTNIPGGTLTLNASAVGATSFKRLTGTQDPSVNDGSTSSSVSIFGGYNGQIVKVIP